MKRPEGYGRTTASPSGPRPTPASAAAPTATPRSSERAPHRPPERKPAPRSRDADAELKAARRERRRHDRAELKRFTRRARRRRLAWTTAIATALVLVAVLLVAVYSPLLSLRTITIDGTSRLESAAIEDAVDGQLGTPLALLDDDRLTRELGSFPLIQSYTTEVQPPDTLAIHIVERQPIGVVQTASAFDLVDPAGIVIESTATRPDGLPLIKLGDAEVGDKAYLAMTGVLLALPDTVLARVGSISATTKDDVLLTLQGTHQRVVWGSAEGSDFKALVLSALLKRHSKSGPGEYDVSAPRSAVFHPL